MKHYWLGFFISLVAVLSACSSTSEEAKKTTAKNSSESELICQTFTPTGSHIKKRVCKTPEQVEMEKLKNDESVRALTVDRNNNRM